VAADLGADIVKAPFTGDVKSMSDVVSSCPIPVITAGGEKASSKEQLYSDIENAMRAGAAGVAVGRNVFEADDVADVTRRISRIVHRSARSLAPVPRLSATV